MPKLIYKLFFPSIISTALCIFLLLSSASAYALPAENPDKILESARSLSAVQNWQESIIAYRKLLALQPNMIQVQAELGTVLFWSGKPDESLRIFSKLPFKKLDQKARITFIDLLISQKDFSTASSRLKTHLRIAPNDQIARMKLADLFSWRKKFTESFKLFQQILKTRPNDAPVRRAFAQVLTWAGKNDQAIAELTRSLKKNNERNSIVPEPTRISRAKAALQLGKLLMDKPGSEEEAKKWLSLAQSDYTNQAEVLFSLGMLALRNKQNSMAQTYFKQAAQAEPQNSEYRLWQARSYVWNKNYPEGMAIFDELWQQNKSPATLLVEMSQAMFWSGRPEKALALLDEAQGLGVHNLDLFQTLGEVFVSLGSFTQAIEAFEKAEALLEDSPESLVKTVSQSASPRHKLLRNKALCYSYIGKTATAEPLLQDHLHDFPDDLEVAIELSRCMRKNQKLDRAITLLMELVEKHPLDSSLLMELGDAELEMGHWQNTRNLYEKALKEFSGDRKEKLDLRWANRLLQMGDFPKAIGLLNSYLEHNPKDLATKRDLAWTLASMERYEEAEGELQQILSLGKNNLSALTTFAQVKLLEGKFIEADTLAKKILLLDEKNDEAKQILLKNGSIKAAKPTWITTTDQQLIIANLRTLVEHDPNDCPTKLSLALELANQEKFSESLTLLDEIAALYPGHYKIDLTRARILSWDNNFDKALQKYEALRDKYPDNPIVYKEAGRVAFWAKKYRVAHTWYEPVLHPDASSMLTETLDSLHPAEPALSQGILLLDAKKQNPSYQRIDIFKQWYANNRSNLSALTTSNIDQRLLSLHGKYLLQRNFYLERNGKELNNLLKPRQALHAFKDLQETAPGNLEILFDQSQIQCSLGLHNQERQTYKKILRVSPQHKLAKDALKKLIDDEKPGLVLRLSQYHEEGRGDLSQMRFSAFAIAGEANLHPRWRLNISGGNRFYKPGIWNGNFRSQMTELKLSGVFSETTRLNMGVSRNNFSGNNLYPQIAPPDRTSGFVKLAHVVRDSLELSLDFERVDAVSNDVALRNGTQADNFSFGVKIPLSKKFKIAGKAQRSKFSDGNTAKGFFWKAEYDLTDFPEIFRLIVSGETRDTDHVARYVYLNGQLADIHFPYWTPVNYRSRTLALQYYRDLSRLKICRADHHYLSLIASYGSDNIPNPSRRLAWTWHLDWNNCWEINLQGFWQDSSDWDANQTNLTLEYRF